jgi:hypothetical protein
MAVEKIGIGIASPSESELTLHLPPRLLLLPRIGSIEAELSRIPTQSVAGTNCQREISEFILFVQSHDMDHMKGSINDHKQTHKQTNRFENEILFLRSDSHSSKILFFHVVIENAPFVGGSAFFQRLQFQQRNNLTDIALAPRNARGCAQPPHDANAHIYPFIVPLQMRYLLSTSRLAILL